ncbi:hypothetical protein CXB51_034619 [Gossypium anomalum]|uniref:DUF7745 domain-containing protein n=1 Tax=Gossypium anomalum TaxID=47600 RepID=A0A8J6CF26_9ROSI|nr:hypothetical protein CXB51_034619 [Gossypium anomalum]
MENGLLDRVEGNANVHRWSEQAQLEKRDSIAEGYVSELLDYTRISVDEHLFRALAQFWNPAYSCFTFGEVDLVPTVEEYTALLRCPRALGYVDEATTDLFHRLGKRVTSVPAILAETLRSLGTCRKAGASRFVGCAQLLLAWFYSHFRLIDKVFCRVFFEDYSPLKDIVASTRRVDVLEKNWIALLQNFQAKNVEWRAPFDWVPLLGIWDAIGYAPLLVLRQFGLRQFVPVTHGLAQSEFVYRGADYKKKVGEISNAWNKTCRLKGIAISPATTPEYIEWRGRRVNDNIPKPSVEGARPELEKKITKLEEDKMYLSLDVDVQKKERARAGESSDQLQKEVQEGRARAEYWERKFQEMQSQNLALEEENKGLKSKVTELGRSLRWHHSHDSTVELKELKSKVDDLEVALHDGELWVEQLKAQEDYLKGELHQAREQVEERDYVIGEAIAQIREFAEYVQDLAIQADVLSLMYLSSSDVGRELTLLLDRVKALGLRAKAYL